MTAPTIADTPVIPAPRSGIQPVRHPRRERPRDQYWDALECRWVAR